MLNTKNVKLYSADELQNWETLILEDTISGTYWESCEAGSAIRLQQEEKINKYIHSHTGCQAWSKSAKFVLA